MKRRDLLKFLSFIPGGIFTEKLFAEQISNESKVSKKKVLTVAHITDVHIIESNNAPVRFKNILQQIVTKHKPDFFLNTGDSISDATRDHVTRERVIQQWSLWDDCLKVISGHEVYSCLGNHDIWHKAPSVNDDMFWERYAVKKLNMPARYYSFNKNNWDFIVLDGNNRDGTYSLDEEQFDWLRKKLEDFPASSNVLVMSHYPVVGTTYQICGGSGMADDWKKQKDLFYKHRDKVKICLSGHQHLADKTFYNGVQFCCNGAVCGRWWGKGNNESAGIGYNRETPPGYAILKLYANGTAENEYYPHEFNE
ncbi:MAG: metallophosphoesterase [Sphingobacteriales bacterium]|nr:metallophosphoesterase [Sphingobacteriales bacterium]OJY84323.1 MAG: metallophosphoesterase [Sphingobacteriales bacterium 44-15]